MGPRSLSQDIIAKSRILSSLAFFTYGRRSGLPAEDLERMRGRSLEDYDQHFIVLGAAVRLAEPALWSFYVAWASALLVRLGTPFERVDLVFECLLDAVSYQMGSGWLAPFRNATEVGVLQGTASFPEEPVELCPLAQSFLEALLECDKLRAEALVSEAMASGVSIDSIYLDVFTRCQVRMGQLWFSGQVGIAHEHYASAVVQQLMTRNYDRIFASPRRGRHMVAACVGRERHELGLRMVCDLLELRGWDTVFLGATTPARDLLKFLRDRTESILALSVSFPGNLPHLMDLIEEVRHSPGLENTRILVGGRGVSLVPDLWRKMGADATALDALEATALAESLVTEARTTA